MLTCAFKEYMHKIYSDRLLELLFSVIFMKCLAILFKVVPAKCGGGGGHFRSKKFMLQMLHYFEDIMLICLKKTFPKIMGMGIKGSLDLFRKFSHFEAVRLPYEASQR